MLYPVTETGVFFGATQLKLTRCSAAVPVPFRLTALILPEFELLENLSVPDAVPMAVGSNFT